MIDVHGFIGGGVLFIAWDWKMLEADLRSAALHTSIWAADHARKIQFASQPEGQWSYVADGIEYVSVLSSLSSSKPI